MSSIFEPYVINNDLIEMICLNFRDFDISVKCENYCTQLFLECLSGCDDDNCYGECHRNDNVCVDSKNSFIYLKMSRIHLIFYLF